MKLKWLKYSTGAIIPLAVIMTCGSENGTVIV